MRNQDIIDGFDAFQGDMADHVKSKGQIVDGEVNKAIAADVYREMDNNGANEVCLAANRADEKIALPDSDDFTQTLTDDVGGEDKPLDSLTSRALKRFRILLNDRESCFGMPSWHERAMTVQKIFPMRKSANYSKLMREYSFKLAKLLGESDRVFGSWKLDFTHDHNADNTMTWDPRENH